MPRVVRVTDYGTQGPRWYISVCDKCGAEVGMSAKLYTRNDAETARCFICEPVPVHPVVGGGDPEDRFSGGSDDDLRAIDDNYDREMTLCELAFGKAYAKGDRA
jgi:hypothetical protein